MLQYLIKFSISLAVLYIFYRAVLRPLTFYQCNRFYLLGYSLLSFVIPFVNIAPWVAGKDNKALINFIPVISNYNASGALPAAPALAWWQRVTVTEWLLMVFCLGAMLMLVKLLRQYLSLRSIRNQAVLLQSGTGVQLFETSAAVSPFSFGNAIYFNRMLHTEEELQRIIQHEFVHVQQKHTIDLLTAELLCVVNWFNPFAWLIRYSIRQNLEFIADNNVVANGINKKEYQYLLLKVTGVHQYSIAGNFNLSNLKKRIVMMNKMKTTRLHLAKFLFVLPLLAVLLLAFRKAGNTSQQQDLNHAPALVKLNPLGEGTVLSYLNQNDTVPVPPPPPPQVKVETRVHTRMVTTPNSKGYIVTIADNNGECVVLVKDKKQTIIKALTLTDWDKNRTANESAYGKIPPPPPPAEPTEALAPPVPDEQPEAPAIPGTAAKPELPDNVSSITTQSETDNKNNSQTVKATVTLKDGTKEVYNLLDPNDKERFEKKYGNLSETRAPAKPATPAKAAKPITLHIDGLSAAAQPLFIVDGVEKSNIAGENSLPANSIKSMNVLRGKTATTLYGSKGTNGVIIINTRIPVVMADSTVVTTHTGVKLENTVHVQQ